jgi:putative transposase
MADSTVLSNTVSFGSRDALNEIPRQGAQQMLARAIENEVVEYLERHADQREEDGRRLVVRTGISARF